MRFGRIDQVGMVGAAIIGLVGMASQLSANTVGIFSPTGTYSQISPSGLPSNEFAYAVDFQLSAGDSIYGNPNNGYNIVLLFPTITNLLDPTNQKNSTAILTQPTNWGSGANNSSSFSLPNYSPAPGAPNVNFQDNVTINGSASGAIDLGTFEFITTQIFTGTITVYTQYNTGLNLGGSLANNPTFTISAAAVATPSAATVPLPSAAWMALSTLVGIGGLRLFGKRVRIA